VPLNQRRRMSFSSVLSTELGSGSSGNSNGTAATSVKPPPLTAAPAETSTAPLKTITAAATATSSAAADTRATVSPARPAVTDASAATSTASASALIASLQQRLHDAEDQLAAERRSRADADSRLASERRARIGADKRAHAAGAAAAALRDELGAKTTALQRMEIELRAAAAASSYLSSSSSSLSSQSPVASSRRVSAADAAEEAVSPIVSFAPRRGTVINNNSSGGNSSQPVSPRQPVVGAPLLATSPSALSESASALSAPSAASASSASSAALAAASASAASSAAAARALRSKLDEALARNDRLESELAHAHAHAHAARAVPTAMTHLNPHSGFSTTDTAASSLRDHADLNAASASSLSTMSSHTHHRASPPPVGSTSNVASAQSSRTIAQLADEVRAWRAKAEAAQSTRAELDRMLTAARERDRARDREAMQVPFSTCPDGESVLPDDQIATVNKSFVFIPSETQVEYRFFACFLSILPLCTPTYG
jgi:hypothetical protein